MAARLHWTWPAKSIMARGPAVELAIVAGNPSDNHWFELAPIRPPSQAHLPTSKIWTNVTTSFDSSDVTFSMTLVRRELRSDLGVPKAKVGFEFIPQPPNVERPDGSIRVQVTGLTCAGKYWLKILGDGSPIVGSPYVVTVAPGPATELRAVPNQPAYRPPKKAEIASVEEAGARGAQLTMEPAKVLLNAGEELQLQIASFDRFGNKCLRGGAFIEVRLRNTDAVRCTLKDRADGTYAIAMRSASLGTHPCRITLLQRPGDTPLQPPGADGRSSPGRRSPTTLISEPSLVHDLCLDLLCEPALASCDAVELVGFPKTLDAGQPVTFEIQGYDTCGHPARLPPRSEWRMRLTRRGKIVSDADTVGTDASADARVSAPTAWLVTDLGGDTRWRVHMMCERAGGYDASLYFVDLDSPPPRAGAATPPPASSLPPSPLPSPSVPPQSPLPPRRTVTFAMDTASSSRPPRTWRLDVLPGPLCIQRCDLRGRGMLQAVAGQPTRILLGLRDRFSNPTIELPPEDVGRKLRLEAQYVEEEAATPASSPRLGRGGSTPRDLPRRASSPGGSPARNRAGRSGQSPARGLSPAKSQRGMGGDAGAVSSFGSAFGRQLGAPREVAFTIERGSDPGTYDVRYTLHQTGAARLTGTYHNGHQEVPLHVPRQFLTVVAGTWDIGRCKLVHAFDDGAPPPVIAAGFTWRARLLLRDAHNNPVPLAASVVVKAKWVLVKDPLDEVTPVSAVATIAHLDEPGPEAIEKEELRTTPPEPLVPITVGVGLHDAFMSDVVPLRKARTALTSPRRGLRNVSTILATMDEARVPRTRDDEVDLESRPMTAGNYKLSLSVDGQLFVVHFTLQVQASLPSAERSRAVATSPLDGATLRVLQPTTFPIAIRDAVGNACVDLSGMHLSVDPPGALLMELKQPLPPTPGEARINPVTGTIQSEALARLTLNAQATGYCELHVAACGKPFPGSPFMLRLLPGVAHASATTCAGEGLTFAVPGKATPVRVVSRDARGYRCDHGGAMVHARLSPAGRGFGELLGVTDHEDGTYTIQYLCNFSARYSLAVLVDNEHVRGSPFTIDVTGLAEASPLHGVANNPHAEASPRARERRTSSPRRDPTLPESPAPRWATTRLGSPTAASPKAQGTPKWRPVGPGGEWVRSCGGGVLKGGVGSTAATTASQHPGGAGPGGAAWQLTVSVPNTPVETSGEGVPGFAYYGEFGGSGAAGA